jgi:Transcription factor Iwr1
VRVVQAQLENEQTSNKRRKLTLLPESDAPVPVRELRGYPILNPAQRLVDDSLKQVFIGDVTISKHVQFVLNDPRLLDVSWLAWSNASEGNLLHACALWNAVEEAHDLLHRSVPGLITGTNAQGQTAYQVADAIGHVQICELLEAYGDEGNYVYDVYRLQEGPAEEREGVENALVECELEGGYGYWNEEGELVLEIPSREDVDENDRDEVDSNDEDWEGNDYPDEWGDSDSEVDEDNIRDRTFRNRPVQPYVDAYDGEYDAAYGVFGQVDAGYDSETSR